MSSWMNTDVARQLGLAAPIIQGPFGGGLSSVALVSAVSEGGGLGSFGVHHLNGEQIKATATAIRAKTSKPFALNLWIPFEDSEDPDISDAQFASYCELLTPYFQALNVRPPTRPTRYMPAYLEQVEAVLAARPAVFSFVFGIPSADILARCKALGIITLGAATTVDEAIALEAAGVDMIVATGFEAGGHRVSFLRSAEASLTGTFALIPQVVDAVKIPVIAAGGIADARGIAAALILGAQAVQIGTAFLACDESAASPLHRQQLFSEQAKYTGLTRVFSGRLARGIRNRLMDDLQDQQPQLAPYPVQNWLTASFKAAAIEQQRPELMSLWSGQGAPLLRHHDAQGLLQALISETTRILNAV